MNALQETTAVYPEQFERLRARRAADEPAWLQPLREHARARFAELGWPTTKHEGWRFTNIKPIAAESFALLEDSEVSLSETRLRPFFLPGTDAVRLTFVNGIFREELSRLDGLPPGARVMTLRRALSEEGEALQSRLTHYADYQQDAFAALNTAFLEDGVCVFAEPGVVIDTPIHAIHVAVKVKRPFMTHPRVLIALEANAGATFVESHIALDDSRCFTNGVTEAALGPGARLAHCQMDAHGDASFHINTLQACLSRDSRLASHHLLVGGAIARNNLRVRFDAPGGEAALNGLYIGRDRQLLDNDVFIDHAHPHCRSEQYFKGVLEDAAHAVFTGRVVVRQDAQKTDAKQTNRNLLLADTARIDAKPQLEIYADDVKCAHGATTGHLDEDALFYLISRGLDRKTARDLLLYGFAHEVIERMSPEPFRMMAERFLHDRFAQSKLLEG